MNLYCNLFLDYQKRCLHVYLYGVDCHIYNRTSVYATLKELFQKNITGGVDSLLDSSGFFGILRDSERLNISNFLKSKCVKEDEQKVMEKLECFF